MAKNGKKWQSVRGVHKRAFSLAFHSPALLCVRFAPLFPGARSVRFGGVFFFMNYFDKRSSYAHNGGMKRTGNGSPPRF